MRYVRDEESGTYHVQSETDPDKFYEVKETTLNGKKVMSCTCPAWKFQTVAQEYRACKHTNFIEDMLEEERIRSRELHWFKVDSKEIIYLIGLVSRAIDNDNMNNEQRRFARKLIEKLRNE